MRSVTTPAAPVPAATARPAAPMPVSPDQVTLLLQRIRGGEDAAHHELFEALYEDLHDRARVLMRKQPPQQTLQATALVHEAFVRLLNGDGSRTWEDRKHFLHSVSRAMRHVLVDAARRRGRDIRPQNADRVSFDQVLLAFEDRALSLIGLDDALHKLETFNPDMARAVELIFFGCSTQEEAARVLEIPMRTFERRWKAARAWLFGQLS